MNITGITTLIVHQQDAEVKAIKRVKFLRDKAQEIVNKAGSHALLTDIQERNAKLFLEIADEIENLNITHKAMYKVLDVKITEAKSKAFIVNSEGQSFE